MKIRMKERNDSLPGGVARGEEDIVNEELGVERREGATTVDEVD